MVQVLRTSAVLSSVLVEGTSGKMRYTHLQKTRKEADMFDHDFENHGTCEMDGATNNGNADVSNAAA